MEMKNVKGSYDYGINEERVRSYIKSTLSKVIMGSSDYKLESGKIIFNDDSYKTVPAGNLKLTEKVGQVSEDRFNYFKVCMTRSYNCNACYSFIVNDVINIFCYSNTRELFLNCFMRSIYLSLNLTVLKKYIWAF